MPRSRSRSSSRSSSSGGRRSKKSKKERSKKSKRRRSRSASRDRSSRKRESKKKSHRRRSRSRSRERRRSRSKSRSRRSSSSSPSPPRQSGASSKQSGPTRVSARVDEDGVRNTVKEDLDRVAAIRSIEGTGFTPAEFTSSASDKVGKIALPGEGSAGNGFHFGTAAEKSSSGVVGIGAALSATRNFMDQMNKEGLCHPSWFSDPKERDAQWTKRLFELRRKLVKERRTQKT